MLKELDKKIIIALQNDPLAPASDVAKQIKVSPQTIIRHIKSMEDSDILKTVISNPIPERIDQERVHLFTKVKSKEQFSSTFKLLNEHIYTRAYNRIYGENFGYYAKFDIPKNTYDIFVKSLEKFNKMGIFQSYTVDKSTGIRFDHTDPLYVELHRSDIQNYFNKLVDQEDYFENHSPSSLFEKLDPIQFLLLRSLNINAKYKQKELRGKYKEFASNGTFVDSYKEEEQVLKEYLPYIQEFFADRSESAIKMDFHRKFNEVQENLLGGIRWSIDSFLFEQRITRVYYIQGIKQEEQAKLYNLFKYNHPGFKVGMDILQNGVFLTFTVVPLFDAKIAECIWINYPDYEIYSADYFGPEGRSFPFNIGCYNPLKHEWRADKALFYENLIDSLK